MKGGSSTPSIDLSTKTEKELEDMANDMGKTLYTNWKKNIRVTEFELIRSMFDENGDIGSVPEGLIPFFNSASLFNDLYKWTMSPVILYLGKKHRVCKVTFGLDLRDKVLIKNLHTSLNGDMGLINAINAALQKLQTREFSKDVFNTVLSGPARDDIFNFQSVPELGLTTDHSVTKEAHIDLICGSGTPNKLANIVYSFQVTPPTKTQTNSENPNEVIVRFYFDETKNDKYGNKGVFIIEATGPWHRVTWLETSLMQCVYEACLKYELAHPEAGDEVKTYDQWLDGALERTAKSIAFTYLIQNKTPQSEPGQGGPSSALFTDRRTGGLVFLLLQNLMFGDMFLSGPPGTASVLPNSKISSVSSNSGGKPRVLFKYNGTEIPLMAQKCLGTAACDAWNILTKLGLPCHPPIGTNAHELRMVASVLYSHLDLNPEYLPLSQIIVDYLYYLLVWKKTKGLAPALPDTVGSIAFMKAAEFVRFGPSVTKKDTAEKVIDSNPTLKDLIGLPRQDSGSLTDFLQVMEEFGFKGLKMASEIDSASTLFEASELKYFCYGAGGFFGDSEKVWNPSTRSSKLAMAVKPTRVICTPLLTDLNKLTELPYIEVLSGDTILGYPVKTGDAVKITNDMLKTTNIIGSGILKEDQIAKISIDRNLPQKKLNDIINYVLRRKGEVESRVDGKLVRYNEHPINISTIFDVTSGIGTELKSKIGPENNGKYFGGRRRTHKRRRINRKKTSKRRR